MRIGFFPWPIFTSLEYVLLWASALLFNICWTGFGCLLMYEMCASSYSCSLSSCDGSAINRLRVSVSAVLWKHLDTWERFVVHSVLSFVTHLLSLPHFYSMSMAFRAKRKINILSQSAILKLKTHPAHFF